MFNPPSAVSFLAIFDYGACASRLRFIENFAVMGSIKMAQNHSDILVQGSFAVRQAANILDCTGQ